ncbi:ferritin-like domain-containing protein [Deinococcus aquiradiocola]|uniref:Ferritin-like domain-containing protein n=1 Tax=Deinococcus aquiradiocola TaxID=393059 RepID=A0A917P9Q4_9DEIO|nr:ferritin-like domain-containing protein [Deinococcus aquiradiocola]GGJ67895.1 hypothetical protein GCM10008939_10300 [Deinococcus aquiradiocola]
MTEHHPSTSRRTLLRYLTGGVAVAGFDQAFGQRATLPSPGTSESPAQVLNMAATAEALAVTFYHHALSGATFGMNGDTRAHLHAMLAAEQAHLDLLGTLGGRPLTQRFSLPVAVRTDAAAFAETGLHLERVLTGAYLAAAHQLAGAGHATLAATAAQLGASEAQHLTLLSHLAGYGPGELTLPAAPLRLITDAPPVLAPFVGAVTAGRVRADLPSAEQVMAFTGPRARPAVSSFVDAHRPAGQG